MNYNNLALVCFIFLAILAFIGLIILWWNPNKKVGKKERDFANKILDKEKKR